ncbi:MAG TPA: DoxX family protein [Chloroflexia bacterium]|jgi:uncharacterized membrane protein YphA (DoxX/SURF4 family)
MDIVLWVAQVLLALGFLIAGANHAFRYDQIKTQPGMSWVAAVPQPLMTFIGICEILGAVGVIVPALTGIWTWLTPLAALGLVLIMALAAGFHIRRGNETTNTIVNVVLPALAAFVAYGRWMVTPL